MFRAHTANKAKKHAVTGWVRNLPDGRVEAIFEGEKLSVDKMIEYCKEGPLGAYVLNVDVKWDDYRGEFQEFRITH